MIIYANILIAKFFSNDELPQQSFHKGNSDQHWLLFPILDTSNETSISSRLDLLWVPLFTTMNTIHSDSDEANDGAIICGKPTLNVA